MSETRKFLKLHNLKIPAGWRKIRLGEDFYGDYGFLFQDGHFNMNKYFSNLRATRRHLNCNDVEGVYLKKKG